MTFESEFPRLDLAKAHVTFLAFSALIKQEDVPAELLETLLPGGQDFVAAARYSRRRVMHAITESIIPLRHEESGNLAALVGVQYRSGDQTPSEPIPAELRVKGQVISRTKDLEDLDIDCHVDIFLSEEEAAESGIGLLLPLTAGPASEPNTERDSFFDEIRGIRAVKRIAHDQGTAIEYSFFMDRPLNDAVSLSIDFGLRARFTPETPSLVLSRATSLAARLGVP